MNTRVNLSKPMLELFQAIDIVNDALGEDAKDEVANLIHVLTKRVRAVIARETTSEPLVKNLKTTLDVPIGELPLMTTVSANKLRVQGILNIGQLLNSWSANFMAGTESNRVLHRKYCNYHLLCVANLPGDKKKLKAFYEFLRERGFTVLCPSPHRVMVSFPGIALDQFKQIIEGYK